ncbi:hypothetical protein, partial [Methylobacterium brachythecii]|uniref:hypothetical protein n=1 Tax=Methylobacterium brachythecii TaxID=1176177 RepID=UPI0024E0B631
KFLEVTLFFIWSKSYGLKGKRFMDAFVLFPKNSNSNAASMDSNWHVQILWKIVSLGGILP